MNTYRKRLVIQDPKQVVLKDVPFQPGQEVEITLCATDREGKNPKEELRTLFQKTQQLHQVQTLTEDDIVAEIEAYRNNQ